jgi:hypothetical protein
MAVSPVPPGYRAIIPYLIVDGAHEALEFDPNRTLATHVEDVDPRGLERRMAAWRKAQGASRNGRDG